MGTIAMYLRVSLDDERVDESNSVANQRDLLSSHISADSVLSTCEVLEFSDDGWSGTNFERPGVKELLEKARKGGISCIIVKDLSRWGRNYPEVSEYLDNIFPFLGIRFISLNEGYDSNTFVGQTAPMDIAFNTIMHDAYCKELSFKVRQSYNSKVLKGEFLTGSPPFGFVKSIEGNRLEVDEEAAETVRLIFSLACQGNTPSQIAIVLNESNIDTPLMYRKRKGRTLRGNHSATNERVTWNPNTIRKILVDERYIGIMVGGKQRITSPGSRKIQYLPESEWIRIPDAHESIVSEEVFKQAGSVIRVMKKASAPQKRALFSGKVRCGCCGKSLDFAQRVIEPYYYCEGPKIKSGHGCFEGKLGLAELKDIVLTTVKSEVQKVYDAHQLRRQAKGKGQQHKQHHPQSQQSLESEIKKLEAQVVHIEQRIIALFEDFADGKIDRGAYISKKDAYNADLEKISSRIKLLGGQLALVATEAEKETDIINEPILLRILKATEVTKEVLTLIDRIIVFDEERIEIQFAFADVMPATPVHCKVGVAV